PIGENGGLAAPQPAERLRHLGEKIELEVVGHELGEVLFPEREAQRLAGPLQRVPGHLRERPIAAHEAPLPGVLELLRAPGLRERRPLARPQGLAAAHDRVDVEERPVRVEHESVHGSANVKLLRAMADRYDELYRAFRWEVPARYNIARDCCGQWAGDASRIALYWEDESGAASRHTFADVQAAANRLSNALEALGVQRGDRVALLLPQRPETAIAYIAIFQMGAIALPLSHLFGPDALEYRMAHAGACAAIAEPGTLANLLAIRGKLPDLKHVIGVAGAEGPGVLSYESLLKDESSSFDCVDTAADDPAIIIYTSGTTGAPKGALHAHRVILGNIPGFVHSHDFFPQPGDVF